VRLRLLRADMDLQPSPADRESFIDRVVDELSEGQGYLVLPDLLPAETCRRIRDLVMGCVEGSLLWPEQILREEQRDRVYGLLWWDSVFHDVLRAPPLLAVVTAFMKTRQIALSGFSAHVLHPGCKNMGIHVDYPYFAMPEPLPNWPPLGLQALFLIDDFRAGNGAPYFVAGSQRFLRKPKDDDAVGEKEQILAKAGSVVLAHALCWHDTTPNSEAAPRVGLLANFTPLYIRPIENPYFGATARVASPPPELRRALGMHFYDHEGSAWDDPRLHRRMGEFNDESHSEGQCDP